MFLVVVVFCVVVDVAVLAFTSSPFIIILIVYSDRTS